jgi:NADH dehydrogenase
VYVIGDLAAVESEGRPVPGVAPAAIQMGRHAAANVLRTIDARPRAPFVYQDKGTLATIGRSAAVGVIFRLELHGFLAWCAWLFIHILMLIGFRNRAAVMFSWAWAYFTDRRSARLITAPAPKLLAERDSAKEP